MSSDVRLCHFVVRSNFGLRIGQAGWGLETLPGRPRQVQPMCCTWTQMPRPNASELTHSNCQAGARPVLIHH